MFQNGCGFDVLLVYNFTIVFVLKLISVWRMIHNWISCFGTAYSETELRITCNFLCLLLARNKTPCIPVQGYLTGSV